MKFALFGLFLLGIFTISSAEVKIQPIVEAPYSKNSIPDFINALIKKLLESARAAIPDPMQIANMNISFPTDSQVISGYFNMTDILETGLKQFVVKSCNVSVLSSKINVVLDIPSIIFNSQYDEDMLFGSIVPMYGSGPVNFRLKHLTINLTALYSFDYFHFHMNNIKNTTVIITLGDATFDLHGIINNEAFSILVSQVMNDIVTSFVNEHTELISKIVSPIIESAINKALSNSNKKADLTEVPSKDVHRELNQDDFHELKKLFVEEFGRSNLGKFVTF